MNTLTGIEAERVNQILKHAVDRLQILSFVPVVWDDDIVVDIKSPAVLNSLEKLWMAEEQLKELDSSQNGMKDIQLVKTAHRAVRAACRNFIADRASLQVVMSRPESQSDDFTKYIKYLLELKSQVLQRLTTTVEDEIANRNMLHDLTERERSCLAMKEELDKQTLDLKEEKAQVSFGLDNTLRKLQSELAEITQHNNIELDSVAKEMNEAINKATADHELRMRQLQDRVDSMDRTVNEVVEKNKEEEQRMRREKTRMENTLNAKIAQYDEDMQSRTAVLADLNEKYNEEAREYAKLKEHFDRIDADINRQNEEAGLLAAVARREAFGKWVLDNAATKILKVLRGRNARKVVAVLKSKSKKGKKGKKGK